jgi:hypothetical protein
VVSFTLRQVTDIIDGPLYQVTNEVTAAADAQLETYVYKTSTQVFSYYATAADMSLWPNSYALAQLAGAAFYRMAVLVRAWDTVIQMNEDLDMSVSRLQLLADELNAQRGVLIIDRTTVVTGA